MNEGKTNWANVTEVKKKKGIGKNWENGGVDVALNGEAPFLPCKDRGSQFLVVYKHFWWKTVVACVHRWLSPKCQTPLMRQTHWVNGKVLAKEVDLHSGPPTTLILLSKQDNFYCPQFCYNLRSSTPNMSIISYKGQPYIPSTLWAKRSFCSTEYSGGKWWRCHIVTASGG